MKKKITNALSATASLVFLFVSSSFFHPLVGVETSLSISIDTEGGGVFCDRDPIAYHAGGQVVMTVTKERVAPVA